MHAVSPIPVRATWAAAVFRAGRRVTRVTRVTRNDITPAAPNFEKRTPDGDERERDVCTSCGFIDYRNPKVVVGCLPCWTDSSGVTRVLLCKRGIEPRIGKWGFPQGFMELGETTRMGAARETIEEAGATCEPGPLLAVYNLPGQVQLLYLAKVAVGEENGSDSPHAIKSGVETLEAQFFTWDEIPEEDELAFPTVAWALEFAKEKIPQWRASIPFVPQQRAKLFFGEKVGFTEEG